MSAVQTARTELFIGGKWQPSADARRIDVIDPATGQVLTSVADASVADGLAAVDAASAALAGWSARAPCAPAQPRLGSRAPTPRADFLLARSSRRERSLSFPV